MKKSLVSIAASLLVMSSLIAQDWPQFLGPYRNSISEPVNLMREWPAEGPEVLWTTNVGFGYGGPVIKDNKVYILDRNLAG